ncbi:MAG: exo-alpha-sialidase, partial [Phycisphaerales bacterium]|nr:exo-alpha-sialidase [Phycisphaerales bacterium]
QFDTTASSFRQAGNACSLDGGRTWHNNPVLDPGVFRTDPVLVARRDGVFFLNTLFVQGSTYRCDISTSTDGGQTWSAPVFAFGGDKAWMAIDNTAGPGDGFLHQAWNTAGNNYAPNQYNRSTNAALSWSDPSLLSGSAVFGSVAVGLTGDVYVVGQRSGQVRFTRALDASDPNASPVSFEPFAVVPTIGPPRGTGAAPNPAGLLSQIWVDLDRSGGPNHGRIYVLAVANPDGDDPADLNISWSDDQGVTWSAPVRVNDDPPGPNNWQWFAALSVAPDGRVDATWYSTHESGNPVLSRLYYSSSSDGGATWAPALPVSPEFNSTLGWPSQNKLGDYTHQVSDLTGVSLAWAATFTGGQDVYFARIGPWDCNANGVPDQTDIALGTAQDCNNDGIPDSCQIASGYLPDRNNNQIPDPCENPCPPDLTHTAQPGRPGYGVPDAILDNNDFFYYLNEFAAGNLAVADLTTTAVAGAPGYGVPNGVLNND